jgi:hypothetical protein
VSRWLQQTAQPQHPDVQILEAFTRVGSYYPVDIATCNQWVTKTGITHPMLRDKEFPQPTTKLSIYGALGLKMKDIIVVDRNLKIVFKQNVVDQFGLNKVLSVLSGLK